MTAGFLIVADDLTGAMDAGAQFAQLGYSTVLQMGDPASFPAADSGDRQVIAVTTDSREQPPERAAELVSTALASTRGRRCYKKIDSTLRGSIGAELEIMIQATGVQQVLLCPAYPTAGRTVRGGRLYVDGAVMLAGEFSRDPACPFTDHIPTLLVSQNRRPVTLLPEELVRRGPLAIAEACRTAPEGIVICDAEQDGDLDAIAGAALELGDTALPCGSAGLARALGGAARISSAETPAFTRPSCQRVLVVAGSRRQGSLAQAQHAIAATTLAPLSSSFQRSSGGLRLVLDQPAQLLSEAGALLLSVSDSPYLQAREAEVAQAAASCAAELVALQQFSGLVLVGGTTARAVCAALDIRCVEILGEISTGVAFGTVDGGPHQGLWLATKAGGFGQTGLLTTILEHLMGAEHG